MDIDQIKHRLREFATARDWDQFHSPKNLASAISVEAAELLEIFQWLSDEGSRTLDADTKVKVEHEVADVFLYLIRLADKLDIDIIAASGRKITINEEKYPVALAKGNAKKYTEFKD
jgi:dCTP diphosphatase